MLMTEQASCDLPVQDDLSDWPDEAKAAMSSLEDAFPPLLQRRKIRRHRYRVAATLTLMALDVPSRTLYTRDINPWGAGFIVAGSLPVHERAMVSLPSPDGTVLHVPCRITRCREFAPGWFEGAVDFAREVPTPA